MLYNASVKCWGYNNKGQLGIDNNTNMGNGSGEMAQLTSIDFSEVIQEETSEEEEEEEEEE